MQWAEIDHTKMEALRDPRVDRPESSGDGKPTMEAKQDDLPLKK
jgi:hypothetical protein